MGGTNLGQVIIILRLFKAFDSNPRLAQVPLASAISVLGVGCISADSCVQGRLNYSGVGICFCIVFLYSILVVRVRFLYLQHDSVFRFGQTACA